MSLDKFDEAYFKVKKDRKGKSTEEEFFGEGDKVNNPYLANTLGVVFLWRKCD